MFHFTSQFINPQKTSFAVSNVEVSQKRMTEKPPMLRIAKLDLAASIDFIQHKMETYIGKILTIYDDMDTGDTYVDFDYWYDNSFNRFLLSELIIAEQFNKYSATPSENVSINIIHPIGVNNFEFKLQKASMDVLINPNISSQRWFDMIRMITEYEIKLGYPVGHLSKKFTSVSN
jgi:hypothetical protein